MKNLKTLALTALTALTTFAAPVEAKVQYDGVNFYTPADFTGHHRVLARTLDKAGVAIIDGEGTTACKGNVYGWYTPVKNYMVICGGTQREINETMTHEAVHVFQDCRTGLKSNTLGNPDQQLTGWYLDKWLRQRDARLIETQYDQEDWLIEIEAFSLERSPETVNKGVADYCF